MDIILYYLTKDYCLYEWKEGNVLFNEWHTQHIIIYSYMVADSMNDAIKRWSVYSLFQMDMSYLKSHQRLLLVWMERRKNFFYLTMHSTHFYLQLYGVR